MLRLKILAIAIMAILPASAHAATPAFSVHKNGTNQTVAQDTDVKLTWSTEGFDTNNNFATDRFTPTVAGKYLIVVSTQCAQAGACMPSIFKNGALAARSANTNINIGQTEQATAIVDMNGTTDYVEAFINSASSVISGATVRTYFSGMQLDGSGGGGGGTPAGSTGDIQFNTSGAFDADTGQLFWDAANNRLGVGTSSPDSTLHINAGSAASLTPKTGFFQIGDDTSGANVNTAFDWQTIQTRTGGGVAANLFINPYGGNVGIGTTGPGYSLDVTGTVRASGEIISTNVNQFRAIAGSYGTFLRNDGTATYLLLTASGDQYGTWNALRPFHYNNASGNVVIGNNALFVQHGGNVGIGSVTPNASAQLDVDSTTKGFLPPRMTTAQVNAIASPADGLMAYDTDTDRIRLRANGVWLSISVGPIQDTAQTASGTAVNFTGIPEPSESPSRSRTYRRTVPLRYSFSLEHPAAMLPLDIWQAPLPPREAT